MSIQSTAVAMVFLSPVGTWVIAQLPTGSDDIWKIAAQSGFNAILVLILLYLSQREREKYRSSIDLLTRAVTEVTLAMTFLPTKFHDNAHDTQRRLDELK